MADKVPIKASFDSAGEAEGLSEFVSGDTVPITHGGTGLTALGSALQYLRTNSAANAMEWGTVAADIEAVVAGNGLSGGGTSGSPQVDLDLNELTAAAVNVANDFIAIIDADDSNSSKKEAISDLITAIAGTGLADSSGVLSIDLNELTAATISVANDSIAIIDADASNATKKESIADLITAIAGVGLAVASGVLSLDLNELTAATVNVAADSIAIIDADDSNATKKESISDFIDAIDGTGLTASSGVLNVDPSSLTSGASLTVDTANDLLILEDVDDGTVYKVKPEQIASGSANKLEAGDSDLELSDGVASGLHYELDDTDMADWNQQGIALTSSGGMFKHHQTQSVSYTIAANTGSILAGPITVAATLQVDGTLVVL